MAKRTKSGSSSSGEGKKDPGTVKTALGDEPLVRVRVKALSVPWTTYQPSPLQEGQFIATEHRAVKGDIIDVPESVFEKYADPSIDAWYRDEEVAEDSATDDSDASVTPLAEMDQAQVTQWLSDTEPTEKEVVEAAEGNPELARKLLNAENEVTGGDPRDGVVEGLSEVISRGG